ncbi:MAG: 2-dehydropantoate 2-reductase [Bacteroidetes bacterium MedPE-SWsnd-G1]|nr:MAG: 2-dehydropantoate 2-reductase [Bacteroidetes bacterium MedPE-SWsnd-G1]
MKILVYGTGGVGGYFGTRMAQCGHQVTFIARGEHLKAIRNKGLQLKSIDGDYHLNEVCATDNPKELKPDFDVIILGVKSWQVREAGKLIKPLVQPNTTILPLQNGVAHIDDLTEILGTNNVLGGFCRLYAKIEAPGIINHFGFPPELIFGELNHTDSERVQKIKQAFEKALFKSTVSTSIKSDLWKKFIFINTVSGLGGYTGYSIGKMYELKDTRKMFAGIIKEMLAIAKARNIDLPNDFDKTMMTFISNQPYDSTASTQRDILEGRPSELENFNGYIVKQGEKFGIETPVNAFIYNSLLPQELVARGIK